MSHLYSGFSTRRNTFVYIWVRNFLLRLVETAMCFKEYKNNGTNEVQGQGEERINLHVMASSFQGIFRGQERQEVVSFSFCTSQKDYIHNM